MLLCLRPGGHPGGPVRQRPPNRVQSTGRSQLLLARPAAHRANGAQNSNSARRLFSCSRRRPLLAQRAAPTEPGRALRGSWCQSYEAEDHKRKSVHQRSYEERIPRGAFEIRPVAGERRVLR